MSINIGPPSAEELRPRITVIGVGGAGGNAIANMIEAEIDGVDFIVANTDAQALNNSIAAHRIQLGPEITRGLGAGSRPEVGRAAAEETVEEIQRALEGVNMVFLAAGMGGGTGTGAAPVIAEVARAKGILTVGVVTKPFLFEGTRRMRAAESGIEELQKHVDTLIVIPNQNLFLVAKAETTFKEAFALADEVLQQGVRSITDLMVMPGLINLDFADVRSVMGEMGKAMMGTGEGEGPNRALEAAERAIANPLLDGVSMHGAKGVIISIIGGEDMKLLEVDEAANHIREMVDPEANIIWGSAFNPDLAGKIRVSVVATGIESPGAQPRPATAAARPLDFGAARGGLRLPPVVAQGGTVSSSVTVEPPAASSPPAPAMPAAPAASEAGADEGEGDPFAAVEDGAQASASPPVFAPGLFGRPAEPAPEREFGRDGIEVARFETEDEGAGGADGTLDLSQAVEADDAAAAQPASARPFAAPATPAAAPADLLGEADRLAGADEQVGGGPRRRRMLGMGLLGEEEQAWQDENQQAAARGAGTAGAGGTLFERMASLSRPAPADEDDEDDDGAASPMRIPRFLNRQNNQ